MAQFANMFEVDLNNRSYPVSLVQTVSEGNVYSNRIGAYVYKDGAPINLGGACTGLVMRADGTTVPLTGYVEGNAAYVVLDQPSCAIPGPIQVAVNSVVGENITTLLVAYGTVIQTDTRNYVEPGTPIPDITELLAEIDNMREATAAAEAAATKSVRYDTAQTLTSAQQATARENIEAANANNVKMTHADGNVEWLADIIGKYIDSNGTESTNNNLRCTGFIRIPDDAVAVQIYCRYSGTSVFNPVGALYDENKSNPTIITNSGHVDGILTKSLIDSDAVYIRVNQSNIASDADQCLIRFRFSTEQRIRTKDYALAVAEAFRLDNDGTDFHDLSPNKIYSRYTATNAPSNAPYVGWRGNLVTVYGFETSGTVYPGMRLIAISEKNEIHVCGLWGSKWSEWLQIDPQAYGYVGEYEYTPSGVEQINTGILLNAGEHYYITNTIPNSNDINAFIYGVTSDYVKIQPSTNAVDFTPQNTGYLILYNLRGNTEKIHTVVYKLGSPLQRSTQGPAIYYVSKSGDAGSYTSFTQCLLDLKDDESEKIIYVRGGDYDLFQEYSDAGVPVYTGDNPTMDFVPYCVWVPKNTHIIGLGLVRLIWMPDEQQTTLAQSKTVSPLNVAGTCTIENIEVHGKNCRYCLHNDILGDARYYGAIQRFVNVRFHKYVHQNKDGTYLGFAHTIGFGIDADMRHEYIDCEFVNDESTGHAFYGHNRNLGNASENELHSPTITCKNGVIISQNEVSTRLDSSGTVAGFDIHTKFENCYMSHGIRLQSGDGVRNAYNLVLLNCKYGTITIDDANNPYPVREYPIVNQ